MPSCAIIVREPKRSRCIGATIDICLHATARVRSWKVQKKKKISKNQEKESQGKATSKNHFRCKWYLFAKDKERRRKSEILIGAVDRRLVNESHSVTHRPHLTLVLVDTDVRVKANGKQSNHLTRRKRVRENQWVAERWTEPETESRFYSTSRGNESLRCSTSPTMSRTGSRPWGVRGRGATQPDKKKNCMIRWWLWLTDKYCTVWHV